MVELVEIDTSGGVVSEESLHQLACDKGSRIINQNDCEIRGDDDDHNRDEPLPNLISPESEDQDITSDVSYCYKGLEESVSLFQLCCEKGSLSFDQIEWEIEGDDRFRDAHVPNLVSNNHEVRDIADGVSSGYNGLELEVESLPVIYIIVPMLSVTENSFIILKPMDFDRKFVVFGVTPTGKCFEMPYVLDLSTDHQSPDDSSHVQTNEEFTTAPNGSDTNSGVVSDTNSEKKSTIFENRSTTADANHSSSTADVTQKILQNSEVIKSANFKDEFTSEMRRTSGTPNVYLLKSKDLIRIKVEEEQDESFQMPPIESDEPIMVTDDHSHYAKMEGNENVIDTKMDFKMDTKTQDMRHPMNRKRPSSKQYDEILPPKITKEECKVEHSLTIRRSPRTKSVPYFHGYYADNISGVQEQPNYNVKTLMPVLRPSSTKKLQPSRKRKPRKARGGNGTASGSKKRDQVVTFDLMRHLLEEKMVLQAQERDDRAARRSQI